MERLKHEGTSHSSSDLLKICVKMGVSWSAQRGMGGAGGTLSGPEAFLFILKKHVVTSNLQLCVNGTHTHTN